VKLASHLKRSPCGVYYFRLVIPRRLRSAHGGKCEIKRSLGTKDPAVARRLAYILSAGANPWLKVPESDPAMASRKQISKKDKEKKQNIALLLHERERAIFDYNLHFQPDHPGQMNYMWSGAEAPRRELHWYREVENLLKFIAKLDDQLRAWGVEPPAAAIVGSVPGMFSDSVTPVTKIAPLVTNSQSGPSPQTVSVLGSPVADTAWRTRLSGGVRAHLEHEGRSASAAKTRMAVEKALSRFQAWVQATASNPGKVQEIAGVRIQLLEADPLLSAINATHIVAYMNHMLTNEVAGRGGASTSATKKHSQVKRGLSKATVYKELGFLNSFFIAMQNSLCFPSSVTLPTKDISPYKRGEKKRSVRKTRFLPFTSQELAKIFEPAAFGSQRKPHEFWVPLLGLYTGARLDEICQLRLIDVQKHGKHIAIAITDTDETKTKNKASERLVPLHEELLALGFTDYVADVRKLAGANGRLFPYLLQTLNGFADVPSEAFSRHLKAVGVKTPRKAFHSFRGTLNEAFTQAGVVEEARSQMLGHAHDSINITHYGRDMALSELYRSALANVSFPEVAKSTAELKYTPGAFIDVLKRELERRRAEAANRNARGAKGLPPLRSSKKPKV
jgi:integrase